MGEEQKLGAAALVAWLHIPTAGRFRVARPSDADGAQFLAGPDEKRRQQQTYGRYVEWVNASGLDEQDLRRELGAAPKDRNKRGVNGVPTLLQERKCDTRRHAVLVCRAKALQIAASAAGRELEGDDMADHPNLSLDFYHDLRFRIQFSENFGILTNTRKVKFGCC